MLTKQPRPFWNPYLSGVLLGMALLLTFILTGHGLGASGFTTSLAAAVSKAVVPGATSANHYFGPMTSGDSTPLSSWITWQVSGVAIGALLGAFSARRLELQLDGPIRLGRLPRLLLALAGGMLSGFGARLSLGCTSGLGLSGAATLASAGFLFLIGFFGSGVGTGLIMKRYWK